MNPIDYILLTYGVIVLTLVWRYTVIVNNLRKRLLLTRGEKTDFAKFIPQILLEAFFFPVRILWYGLEAWIKELE